MIRRCTLLLGLLFVGGLFQSPLWGSEQEFEELLFELQGVEAALGLNLHSQERAWPLRRAHQLQEAAPPEELRERQEEFTELLRTRKRILNRIQNWLPEGRERLRAFLARTGSPALAQGLVPLLVGSGPVDEPVRETLNQLARRFSPIPGSVLDAIRHFGDLKGGLILLWRGRDEGNVAYMRAAGDTGHPRVLKRLVDLAQSDDTEVAELAIRALGGLNPPRKKRGAALSLVKKAVESSVRTGLKASLVAYLGLFQDSSTLPLLERLAKESRAVPVRVAAVGALGEVGGTGAIRAVLRLFRAPSTPTPIRQAAILALARLSYEPVVPELIATLRHPELRWYAHRALRRLTGERLEPNHSIWRDWYRKNNGSGGDPFGDE